MHYYHAFGLKLESALPLPELQRGSGPADVVIDFADGEHHDRNERWLSGAGEHITLHLDDMVFTVEGGRSVRIAAPPGTGDNDIRLWLLGTVMATLLHQRGYFPLHANSVLLASGGVAAFSGPSGAGKSTMAALLDRQAFRVLGDDLCAIRLDGEQRPMVYGGIPRLKLWQATLDLFGRARDGLEPVASDYDKFHVPLDAVQEVGSLDPRPLERLYLLGARDSDDEPLIQPLRGILAADGVLDNAFRWMIGQSVAGENSRVQFDQAMAIARKIAVFRVARRWGTDQLFEEGALIAAHLSSPLTNKAAAGGVGS